MTADDIRFIIGTVLILCGLMFSVFAVLGVYRFKYALNRMHAAAINDTLGILFVLGGLIIICGFTFHTLKFALVIIFFWFASPVSGHLISRLEVLINEHIGNQCDVLDDKACDKAIHANIEKDDKVNQNLED